MDNREAKFILSAYRPGEQDAGDPRFSEALEHARRDPLLERWFRESIAFDTSVTEKFSSIPVPPGLRESILAGAKISRASKFVTQRKVLAIAAGLLVAATVAALALREFSKPQLAGWQTEALGVISSLGDGRSNFDAQSHNADELINWLQARRFPAEKLPRSLQKLESVGCKTFYWNGQPASVICFVREDGRLIHLVITTAAVASKRTFKGEPELVQQENWATATWREGNMLCMIAIEGSRDHLESYLL